MEDYPDRTVDDVAAGFFESAEWEGFDGEDGLHYVNLKGIAALNGRQVRMLLQFAVDVERASFRVYAVTVDGEPQGEKEIWMIFDTMFGQGVFPGEVVHIRWELHPKPSRKALPAAG